MRMLAPPRFARHAGHKSQGHSVTSMTDSTQLPTAQRHLTRAARHWRRQSQWRRVPRTPTRRCYPQPPIAFHATHRHVPGQRQPATTFCETSVQAYSRNPRIPCACHDFAATQNDTQRLTRSHSSPRLPRETSIRTRVATRSRTLGAHENESNTIPPPDPHLKIRTLRYAFGNK